MRDIPFQQSICHASADFAHRRMTHRSLGIGGYGFGGPRACPWGSMKETLMGGMQMSFFAWNMEMSFLWYALYITASAWPRKSG